jgi:hypothetical protein
MNEVLLNDTPRKTIVTFHANTIEFFSLLSNTGGVSFHIGHLKSIEISADKKGKNWLVIKNELQTFEYEVSEKATAKAKELVTAVQDAMKTVRL